jgi:hypothetical protein
MPFGWYFGFFILNQHSQVSNADDAWYLSLENANIASEAVLNFLTFIVLLDLLGNPLPLLDM